MDCMTFHLLSVFQSAVAETQQFYISNRLKKLNRVSIRQFVQRVQQLNGYLNLLPCLFYSGCMTKLTKAMEPFSDVDLASHTPLARPVQAHGGLLYPRVSVSYSKHLNASKRPS